MTYSLSSSVPSHRVRKIEIYPYFVQAHGFFEDTLGFRYY